MIVFDLGPREFANVPERAEGASVAGGRCRGENDQSAFGRARLLVKFRKLNISAPFFWLLGLPGLGAIGGLLKGKYLDPLPWIYF